jgi:Tol biopolymer transport system component
MKRRTLTWAGLAAALAVLVLALAPGAVQAKKPPKDPEPPAKPEIATVVVAKFGVRKVLVMNADGTNRTIVYDGEGAAIGYRPDWSPDGTKLVFWSNVDGPGIYIYDLEAETLTKVCETMTSFDFVCSPVWSPVPVPDGVYGDGETYYLAYTDQGSDQINDVFLVEPVEGATPIQLTDTEEDFEIGPTWSPSASTLVIKWAHDDYRVGDKFLIYDMETGTLSDPIQLQEPFNGTGVSGYRFCHGTENKLVCNAYGDIWTFELDGENTPKNPINLTNTSGIQESRPSWSADDTKIVFMAADVAGGKWLKNHRFEVIDSTDGSDRTKISDDGSHPVWRHDVLPD